MFRNKSTRLTAILSFLLIGIFFVVFMLSLAGCSEDPVSYKEPAKCKISGEVNYMKDGVVTHKKLEFTRHESYEHVSTSYFNGEELVWEVPTDSIVNEKHSIQ